MIFERGVRKRTQPRLCERIGPTCAWKPCSFASVAAVVADRHRQEMKLDVRVADAGAAADEAAGLEMIAGAEPVVAQQPARTDQERGSAD